MLFRLSTVLCNAAQFEDQHAELNVNATNQRQSEISIRLSTAKRTMRERYRLIVGLRHLSSQSTLFT